MNSASRGLWPVVGLRRPGKAPFASAEADAWRGASWEADFNRRQRPSAGGSACTPNEFGLQGPLADGRTTPTWKSTFCVGGGRRLARSALRGRFQSAPRPSADGRPARRMNSASRGLWPTVGLRRSGEDPFASAEADAWRGAPLEADFNRCQRPLAGGRPAPIGRRFFCVGGGRRLARQRLERPISIGVKGLWPVVGLRRSGEDSFASAEADAWRGAPGEADFNRRQGLRPVGRPARRMNSASRGLWPTVGLRRPGEDPFASAEADAWRGAPGEADFNRRQGLRPVGRSARRMNSASRGLWPVVGLRRPGKAPFASAEADARRGAPEEADFNRHPGGAPDQGFPVF
jgi:hypothetical protein